MKTTIYVFKDNLHHYHYYYNHYNHYYWKRMQLKQGNRSDWTWHDLCQICWANSSCVGKKQNSKPYKADTPAVWASQELVPRGEIMFWKKADWLNVHQTWWGVVTFGKGQPYWQYKKDSLRVLSLCVTGAWTWSVYCDSGFCCRQ